VKGLDDISAGGIGRLAPTNLTVQAALANVNGKLVKA